MRSWTRTALKVLSVALPLVGLMLATRWAVRAYVGDITYDDVINALDLAVIEAAFGHTIWSGDPAWNPEADLNRDGRVNVEDLAIAGRSYGSDSTLHEARRLANSEQTTSHLDACLDGHDQLHVIWSEAANNSVHYTRLDRYGNTLIDDVQVDRTAESTIDLVAVGCDADGNAHLLWDCVGGICQARFDAWGYPILPKTRFDDRASTGTEGSIDLDSQGHAHALYEIGTPDRLIYAMLTAGGENPVSIEDPLLAGIPVTTSRYREIAVDGQDNVHLIWSEEEGEDRLYYARLGADGAGSIPAITVGLLQWDGTVTSAHRPSLALDAQGHAFVLWNGGVPTQLYLDKIGTDGSAMMEDVVIFPEWKSGYQQDVTVGPDSRLHLVAPTTWGRSGLGRHAAYGTFDNDGQPADPMRWMLYGWLPREPQLLVDSQNDLHLLFAPYNVSSSIDLPCPASVLCYQSAAFDPITYDRARPDLGVDVAHLDWTPALARWGEPVTVTVTVFSAGWVDSPATALRVDLLDGAEQALTPPVQAQISIPALAPRRTHETTITLDLPTFPPAGYETLAYARLAVHVDPNQAVAETTEANNRISAPLMIQPLPTYAGLFLMVQDLTPTSRGGDAVPLNTGSAHLVGPELNRDLILDSYVSVLADVPLGTTMVTYTVSWEASGYRTPGAVQIAIGRNPLDPYEVDYNPTNTAILETDTWGAIEGTLTAQNTGSGLAGATIRVQGQGVSLQVTSDAAGSFSATTTPALGKLPPGSYRLHASAAGYARVDGTADVPALGTVIWNRTMVTTTHAYVRGSLINPYGRPVSDADLNACGITGSSASDGSFDLGAVDATCTVLTVAKPGSSYTSISEPLALTAGLETYLPELVLPFDPTVAEAVIHDAGGLASWYQDESSDNLLPDPPDDATWVEKKLFGVFSDRFWPSYRVQVWWGCYDFAIDAATRGPTSDRRLAEVQVRLTPKTFEAHRVSGSGTIKVYGRSIKVSPGVFQDSGVTTALYVIEARLVDGATGQVIKTVRNPIEGGGAWLALQDATRTYNFGDVEVPNWDRAEVWVYLKVGKNDDGAWRSSPILRGWHFEQQVLRFDLSEGEAMGDFVIVDFPLP